MSTDPTHPGPEGPLSPADNDALNALVEAGFDVEQVPPALRSRACRLADLLGLLDPAPAGPVASHADRSALVDATLARAARGDASEGRAREPRLVAADAAALDTLVESGWRVPDAVASGAWRASHIQSLLAGLGDPLQTTSGGRSREDLISATMRRVEIEGAPVGRLGGARDHAESPRPRFTLSDLASVAAVMLIGLSILWPTISATREEARLARCETGLQNAGLGFGLYAAEHEGKLPARSGPKVFDHKPREWWRVGEDIHSHSANLYVLAAMGYSDLGDLSCPGNEMAPVNINVAQFSDWRNPDEVSYSYRFFREQTPKLSGPVRYVLLVDKSPVVDRARRGERFDPGARSLNHRGHGQNILWNDGSVQWISSPVLESGDNVWLPRVLENSSEHRMTGDERPDGLQDAFVGP